MTHDNLHDRIGQAIADYLASVAEDNVVTFDPFDARNIDAIVEEVMPVVKAELDQVLTAQEQTALIAMEVCNKHDTLRLALRRIAKLEDMEGGYAALRIAHRALAGQCIECGSSGFKPSVTGRGCTFCDGTEGGHPPVKEN